MHNLRSVHTLPLKLVLLLRLLPPWYLAVSLPSPPPPVPMPPPPLLPLLPLLLLLLLLQVHDQHHTSKQLWCTGSGSS
jgi:hypothetical protein